MKLLAFNEDLYLGIVFIHVFAAIVWLGGAFVLQVKTAQFRKANDTAGFLQVGRDAEQMGQRVFMPASVVVLLAGIAMVWYGPYGFELWIGLALVGIVITVLTGIFFLGPQAGRLVKLAEERGVDDPAVTVARDRLITVSRIDYLILVLIVLDMVFKPGA